MNSDAQRAIRPADILGPNDAEELASVYGTPLYIYSAAVLRSRCREVKGMVSSLRWKPFYSMKANGNLSLLRIIRSEGLCCDTMSPGETEIALRAGFSPEEILFVPNNVSAEEFRHAAERG